MPEAIRQCIDLRSSAVKIIAEAYGNINLSSEHELANELIGDLEKLPTVLQGGWYDPPTNGVAVLYSGPSDNFKRSRFDTLRNEAYWPSKTQVRNSDGIAIIYLSPVTNDGIIGDWGGTFYTGNDPKVKDHLKLCLQVVEELADYSKAGIEYGEISRYADKLLSEHRLTTERTLLSNGRGATGTNCGHTIPFTSIAADNEELATIASGDQKAVNSLISSSRVFVNASETTIIQPTSAFTTELRLESVDNPNLPNVFFHIIVTFVEGKKQIVSNYNQIFSQLGMDYIQARF